MSTVTPALRTWAIVVGLMVLGLFFVPNAAADEEDNDVENFEFSTWDVTYEIALDADGRANAEVAETLVAEFPQTDQNRGIIRSLPLRYQGAPAAPENIRVTDQDGIPVPFEIENEDGFRSVLIGDDSFVHGSQEYNITYTVDDVMHATETADEFYWDLVPVDRQQPVGEVTASITFDAELTAAMTGDAACYRGSPDDTQDCAIEPAPDDESTVVIHETELPAGQGITAAVGVEPGTVTQPEERQENFWLDVMPLIFVGAATLLSAGGAVAALAMVRRYRNDTSHSGVGYGIPEGINPLVAKRLHPRGRDEVVAMILELAVRGALQIEQDTTGKKPKPVLRLTDPHVATDPLEQQLLKGLFPQLQIGDTFDFPSNDKTFTKAVQQMEKDSTQVVTERGYRFRTWHRGAVIAGLLSLALIIPAVVLIIMGASRDNNLMMVFSLVLGVVWLIGFICCVAPYHVHTPRGAAVYQQLERMREMIGASERDRLEMMQSFTGAQRRYEHDSVEVLQIYDRLLPYAVLFGMQKDWSSVMASAYAQQPQSMFPIWYPMLLQQGGDNMSDALSSMLDSVSSAAATSSPNAGSTGGGVAGGGGGGGAAGGR